MVEAALEGLKNFMQSLTARHGGRGIIRVSFNPSGGEISQKKAACLDSQSQVGSLMEADENV